MFFSLLRIKPHAPLLVRCLLYTSALDDDESSRIETSDDNILFIVDIPFTEVEENTLTYDTYPLGIIHTNDYIITCLLYTSH